MLDRREQDIVSLAQSGDKHAFGELVERYQNLVTSIAFSRTGDLQRSEDIAQQVFLIAWQKKAELREPERYGGWLRSIARHVTLNSNRKSKRLDRPAPGLEADQEPAETLRPDEAMDAKEQQQLLWASLQNIPEDYREPLILFYREDQSVQQVAQQMGLSVDAVKQRLVRGRAMLKSEVEQFVEDLLGSTKPDASFAPAVIAALPVASSAIVQTTVKSGVLIGVKSMLGKLGLIGFGSFLGVLGGLLGGAIGVGAAWFGTRAAAKYATSKDEEDLLWGFFRTVTYLTLGLTAISIGTAFTVEGQPLFVAVTVSSILYSLILGVLIVKFFKKQNALHEIHGKPEYPSEFDQSHPQTPNTFRFATTMGTVGCWSWVFVLGAIDQAWIVLLIAATLVVGHLARLWMFAKTPMSAPDQLRFQAKAVFNNALMAAILVSVSGFVGSRLELGPVPNWSVSLGVFAICALAAGGVWYGASRMEKTLDAQAEA